MKSCYFKFDIYINQYKPLTLGPMSQCPQLKTQEIPIDKCKQFSLTTHTSVSLFSALLYLLEMPANLPLPKHN